MKNVIFQLLWFCFITFNWSNIERFNTKRWYKACVNSLQHSNEVRSYLILFLLSTQYMNIFKNLKILWKYCKLAEDLITWRNAKVLEHLSLCINCYTVCSPIFYIKKKVEGGWTFKRPGVTISIYTFIIRERDYTVAGIYWNRSYVFLYSHSSGSGSLLQCCP